MNVTVGMHVNQLPSEMLENIFAFLQPSELARSVCPVCSRWNDVAVLLLKRLTFYTQGSTQDVLNVVGKATLLESIEIHNRTDFDTILDGLSKHCEHNKINLKEISLKMAPTIISAWQIVDGVLVGCLIRWCCNTDTCPNVDREEEVINSCYIINLMELCPKLKKLSIQNVIIKSTRVFNEIGAKLRSLTHLTIISCEQFTPASLHKIASNCTQLTHVTLLENMDGREAGVKDEDEEVASQWSQAYHALLEKRAALLQLLEIDAEFIMDYSLQSLSNSTRLHTLCLDNAFTLSAVGISVISSLANLKHLQIRECPFLHEESIKQLLAPGNLSGLSSLSLVSCSGLTDKCLKMLATSCPELLKVDFSVCPSITDRGVEFIMLECRKLRQLNLYRAAINFSSLQLIPEKTPCLKLLVIDRYGCDKAKKKLHEDLVSRCPDLEIKVDGFPKQTLDLDIDLD